MNTHETAVGGDTPTDGKLSGGEAPALAWYTSASADATNHDQEVDLAKVGRPGGAEWASVAPDGTGWAWEVFDGWLIDDADTLAGGSCTTESEAKAAVEAWVASR